MVNINEDGKYYSAYDHVVHEDDRDIYVDDWVWDTYLAQHHLLLPTKNYFASNDKVIINAGLIYRLPSFAGSPI